MRIKFISLLFFLVLPLRLAHAQGTVPTFQHAAGQNSYTLAGQDPARGGTTTIPTLLVPITFSFEAKKTAGKAFVMDAAPDVPRVLRSPVFSRFAFPSGGTTQYADAMLRTTFPKADGWHTLLGKPEVKPVKITVPAGYGYVLTSKKSGGSFAVVDVEFLQKELFKQLPKQEGKLVIAMTHNTTYYAEGDATMCCSWGTHGVDSATGNSFVLGSYLHAAPTVVEDDDVQPLTQQLAEFINDPLHDPLRPRPRRQSSGKHLSQLDASRRDARGRPGQLRWHGCRLRLLPSRTHKHEPEEQYPRIEGLCRPCGRGHLSPAKRSPAALVYRRLRRSRQHLQLPGRAGADRPLSTVPGTRQTSAAQAGVRRRLLSPRSRRSPRAARLTATGSSATGPATAAAGSTIPLREVSPQWDVIIVAFSTPDRNAPEGTMQFRTPAGLDTAQFKADIAYLKSQGKKVMISLGGGGQHFTLADPKRVPNFVSSVTRIVSEYGFDGIDIDFESPSLSIDPGDTDFKHPTTPSIVNLISALRQLRDHFGAGLMISLVPEGTQIPSGYPSYGGQFGSYLAITYAIRDILSFMDVQDYNTPPLQGLDGEIYQPGTVDYHAAMTELLLHGFNVGGDPQHFFPPMPAEQGCRRLPDRRHDARHSQPGDGLHHHGQGSRRDHVQAAQARRLPRHDRRHVLDHQRRSPW